uniref:Ubiquitin-like domain-containing protein n=1 Tax=Paramoeba aestuarina TaxID=180227 RepID=A0A7S4NDB5_9EUKA|mmetsp:Transcript_1492/g.2318  ORF Transcript_1492/g.2318 Transcript_1492/m.2318 type:complete len:114 (+) Transcript_1492:135-476(+)
MKVTVFHTANQRSQVYDLEESQMTVKGVKSAIFDLEGIPIEYQQLSRGKTKLSSDAPLARDDNISLTLIDMDGGDPHFDCGNSFVCIFRCMCCYSGIDSEWKKCQWFCCKCGI